MWEEYLEIETRGCEPLLVARRVFQANAFYPWPDIPDHWFARLIATQRWHLVKFNVLTGRVRIDLSREWSYGCSLGYEAWVRWNLQAERQLVQQVDPLYRPIHTRRVEAFRQILVELMEAKELLGRDS